MSKLVRFPGVTKLDSNPRFLLEDTLAQDLEGVVVLGCDRDGDVCLRSSYADGGTVMRLMETCKHRLLQIADGLAGDRE